jgi:hypothetical protein
MELLLNLLWLLLVVPAAWVWLRRYRGSDSLRCVLTLGCALILLFPVISATDDLRAMRQEMEEPGPSKRTLKQLGASRAPAQIHCSAPHARLNSLYLLIPSMEIREHVLPPQPCALTAEPLHPASGRAPPSAFLG